MVSLKASSTIYDLSWLSLTLNIMQFLISTKITSANLLRTTVWTKQFYLSDEKRWSCSGSKRTMVRLVCVKTFYWMVQNKYGKFRQTIFKNGKRKNNHSIVWEEEQTYYLIKICSSEFIDSIEDDDNNHLSRYQSIADKGGCSSHRWWLQDITVL